MKAIRLQTEYLTNPIGIDVHDPRLSWNCEGGIAQTAYRIVAETEGITVWDSGKVVSSCMREGRIFLYARSLSQAAPLPSARFLAGTPLGRK